jgi:hypothetical protein
VRGWDELFPTHLNLVSERRLYPDVDANAVALGPPAPDPAAPAAHTDAGILPGMIGKHSEAVCVPVCIYICVCAVGICGSAHIL